MTHSIVTITPNPAIDRTVTIPGFIAGNVNRVEHQRSAAGGKGVNVAAALAAYGHDVVATGFLGSANTSLFESLFSRLGIADDFIRIAGETRVGIKIIDPLTRQTTDINFPGEAPTGEDVTRLFERAAELAAGGARWFVLAGSLPPGVDAGIYRDLTRALKAAGNRVALDSSGDALRRALEASPDLIKPNIHELEDLVGRPLATTVEIIEAAREIIAGGVELVVVSMGADGALFVEADAAILARAPRIDIGSTVGAGDAMLSGTVAGRIAGLPLESIARLATAFSLEVLAHQDSGSITRQGVEARLESIEVIEGVAVAAG